MAAVTLSGIPVLSGDMVIPYSGLWHASLELDLATDISGPQVLSIGGVNWACAVVRAIDFTGRRGVLVVGGAGGWRTAVPAKQYGAGSVPIAGILADAAMACGETPPVGATGAVPAFDRQGDKASLVLQQLLGDSWWISPAGVVQCGARATPAVTSPFVAMSVDGAPGIYVVATESPNDWQPGASFSSSTVSGSVSRVTHRIRPNTLRTEVMVSAGADRLRTALESTLAGLLPSLAAYVKWEYRVVSATPGEPVLVSGSPVSAACPFGTLANIQLWPGASGGYAVPAPGTLITVEFHEGNTEKPAVANLDPSVPATLVTLGGPTSLPAALAAPSVAALGVLESFVAAVTTAAAEPTYNLFAAQVITAGGTAASALPPVLLEIPTKIDLLA